MDDAALNSAREELRQTRGLAVPIVNANGTAIVTLSLWNVGDCDLLDVLKSHHGELMNSAMGIQTSLDFFRFPH